MQRYFIQLSYNGTAYKGWQVQRNAVTVQSVLNETMSTYLREKIMLQGAGRTDTGVHSSHFVAHFDTTHSDLDAEFIFRLNGFLPNDIAVQHIYKVNSEAHARFNALSRTYEYHITRVKNPFTSEVAFYVFGDIDIKAMNKAANMLFEYEDFTSFCKKNSTAKTMICKIMYSQWEVRGDKLVYTIKADRFLRNMVRAIMGTLLLVGLKRIQPEEMRKIIESKDRGNAGFSAPARGLFLTTIEYPDSIY